MLKRSHLGMAVNKKKDTLLGQVNPGGARVAALDLQDDTKFVVDAAVAEFNEGKVAV